jgi:hypothetical protein
MHTPPTQNPQRPAVSDALPEPAEAESNTEDDAMRARVKRLARPHRSGGWAIERATLLAAGARLDGAVAWIEAHGGTPELPAAPRSQGGLHSPRATEVRAPLRFVLPASALP